jgi:hypothetical protein
LELWPWGKPRPEASRSKVTAAQTGLADSETLRMQSRDKLLRLDSAAAGRAVVQVGSGRAAGQEYSYSVVGAEEGEGAAHRAARREWMLCGVRNA